MTQENYDAAVLLKKQLALMDLMTVVFPHDVDVPGLLNEDMVNIVQKVQQIMVAPTDDGTFNAPFIAINTAWWTAMRDQVVAYESSLTSDFEALGTT